MSCCAPCLKVIVLDQPAGLPSDFLEDGRLYLDLSGDQVLELSKRLSELSRLNEIKDEAAFGASVPSTPKNDFIFDYVRNFNLIGNDHPPLSISVIEDGTPHNFTLLYAKGFNDASDTYDVEFRRGDDHWLKLAKETFISESATLGSFEFNILNIQDNWANNHRYTDGDLGIWFPLAHYGGWWSQDFVVLEDFRPWFHILSVLQKVFCEIGWNFRSPWLETDEGRQLGVYLSGESYGLSEVDNRFFRAHFEGDITTYTTYWFTWVITRMPFDTIDNNPGGYFNGISFEGGPTIADFYASVEVTIDWLVSDTDTVDWQVRLIRFTNNSRYGSEETIAEVTGILELTETSFKAEIRASNVRVYTNQEIYVQIESPTGTSMITAVTGFFTNTPKRALFAWGDTIDLADVVDPNLTLLDYLKGVTHLSNAKFLTDWNNKTLWMYTPYDVEWYGNSLDGFYENTVVSLSVLEDTQDIAIEKQDLPRYLRIQFARSSDAFVDRLNLPDDEPLFSREVDFGVGLDETEINENPLFEPTRNASMDKFPTKTDESVNYDVDAPHLWDNDNGELSFKLGFRVLFFEGQITQPFEDDAGAHVQNRAWIWEGLDRELIPYAYQFPNAEKREVGVNIPLITRIVYGEDDNDLYNLGYRQELTRRNFASRVGYDVLLPVGDYRDTDFRSLYKIYYAGRTAMYRAVEIAGRRSCSEAPAQMIFAPEPYVGDVCDDATIVIPETCPNFPRIDIIFDFGAGQIGAQADDSGIDSPIATDTWEYSTDGGSTWNPYTPPTLISPAAGETTVRFRRTVTFTDSCPDKIVTRTGDITGQCANNPTISIDYDEGTNTVAATGGGDFNSSIDTDTWTVSIDGGVESAYTPGTEISGFSTITFKRTVTFTNSCPDITVLQNFTPTPPICQNTPDLVLTEVADCVYDLSIGGTVNSSICMAYIEVSRDGGTTWKQWDGKPLVTKVSTKVRLTVNYCDHCPASYVEKDCPLP